MSRILCIGSVNLDHTYRVPHIVRSSETIACVTYRRHWGGKGLNQALALARAGADVCLAAMVSAEDLPALNALGVDNHLDTSLVKGVAAPTGHAVIQIDGGGQNAIVVCAGANAELDSCYIDSVLSAFGPADLLLLQNEVNNVPGIIAAARSKRMKVVLNPSPISPDMAAWPINSVNVLIFNEVEGEALSGCKAPDGMLQMLSEKYPETALVLTLGENGSRFLCGSKSYRQPIYEARAVDTTAAGDTFTGYFLSELIRSGGDVRAALATAAKASAIAVSRPGAVDSIPTVREVEACDLPLHGCVSDAAGGPAGTDPQKSFF